MSRMARVVGGPVLTGWLGPTSGARGPHAMFMVDGKETKYGTVSVAAYANEGMAPPPLGTWYWSAWDFSNLQTAES